MMPAQGVTLANSDDWGARAQIGPVKRAIRLNGPEHFEIWRSVRNKAILHCSLRFLKQVTYQATS
jgi:hypothetical protein